MIVRERPDHIALLITQEDHAELSAQLAAHWETRNSRSSNLSTRWCVNGYEGEGLKEDRIGRIPVSYNTEQEATLRILPVNGAGVQITPYPFDVSPLKIALRVPTLRKRDFRSDEECREAYFKAPRALLAFEITR